MILSHEHFPTQNQDERPINAHISILVLHYTGMATAKAALHRMQDPTAKVSAHWCIDEDGRIYSLVPEKLRAWHAGLSYWRQKYLVNDISIGIELVNPGHENGYRPFPARQMKSLTGLAIEILSRYEIPAQNVVGHSDISPHRKKDPGELFDWRRLSESGIGLWPTHLNKLNDHFPALSKGSQGLSVKTLQEGLFNYGYGLNVDGIYGEESESVITAFQRHFRQGKVDGIADNATLAILQNLLYQIGIPK